MHPSNWSFQLIDKVEKPIDDRRETNRPSSLVYRPSWFAVTAFLLAVLLLSLSPAAFADVKLKIAVVNPSSTDKQLAPVRYDLPQGVGPGQIMDIGELEMKYDFDKAIYYLSGSLELAPLERKVLEVTLRDVWTIPQTDLTRLKDHAALLMKKLKDTKHEKAGNALVQSINARLDAMAKRENTGALPIKDRMNQFYEDRVVLSGVKESVGMLENLVLDTGGIVAERVQVPETLAVPIAGTQESGAWPVIELKVKVTNPSPDKKMNTPVKFVLPLEVNPRHILDSGGLDMTYDFGKKSFCLYKDPVELAPGEMKEFVVKIQDVWRITKVEMDALRDHTKNILVLLEGSEYYDQAKHSADKIHVHMDLIAKSQDARVSAMEHIAYYRDNMKLLGEAKQELADLEKLVSQRGVSPGVTVKWPDEAGGGEGMHRKRGYEGIDMVAQSIFKGKAPTSATTWKIIFSIIGFIGVIAALFFGLWFVQVKKKSEK
jgi:hypothetical protein